MYSIMHIMLQLQLYHSLVPVCTLPVALWYSTVCIRPCAEIRIPLRGTLGCAESLNEPMAYRVVIEALE